MEDLPSVDHRNNDCGPEKVGKGTKEAWAMTEKNKRPKPKLHIDLFNFEDPSFEGSKYVLTSPRSLEACSRLGIKPVELLYQPLIDIQEELGPRGLPMSTIYSAYEQTEKERQNKLALCMEERNRIISQDPGNNDGGRIKTPKKVTIKEDLSDSPDSGTEMDSEADDGSLQRRRTAWTTSIGHERITRSELEKRAQDLHARALALREATLNLTRTKPRSRRKAGTKATTGKTAAKVGGKKGTSGALTGPRKALRKAASCPKSVSVVKLRPDPARGLR